MLTQASTNTRSAAPPSPSRPAPVLTEPAPAPPGASIDRNTGPSKLVILLDEASQRFVQTLLDASNDEIVRRYPSTGQLAFSKGVHAYQQAQRKYDLEKSP